MGKLTFKPDNGKIEQLDKETMRVRKRALKAKMRIQIPKFLTFLTLLNSAGIGALIVKVFNIEVLTWLALLGI